MAPRELPNDDPTAPPMLPRGRRALPREDYLTIQRARLIAAMNESAATRGYAATSLRELTRLAGVSKSTFYEVFATKEDCFLAAFESSMQRAREQVLAAYDSDEPWLERLRSALGAFLELAAREPGLTRMYLLEVAAAGPRALALRDSAVELFAALLRSALRSAPGRPEASESSVRALVGGIQQILRARVLAGDVERLPGLRDELLYATLVLVMTPVQAARASGLPADDPPPATETVTP
ncbi:MAG TPA: TetR/AcrR family transcriptional regulator [Solirubrobacteraceae bacterium]|nr:TetR/AcrR family transcriptional regulator [Solirubrobacteraceae bacterium]